MTLFGGVTLTSSLTRGEYSIYPQRNELFIHDEAWHAKLRKLVAEITRVIRKNNTHIQTARLTRIKR